MLPIGADRIYRGVAVRCLGHVRRSERNENLAVYKDYFRESDLARYDGPDTTPNLLRGANHGSWPIYGET